MTQPYYDAANRDIADENVGTNGGAAWTRPGTPDASDATHLTTFTSYGANGLTASTTDPRGIVSKTFYNLLGETTETIAAYTGAGTPTNDTNQTTLYTYTGNGDEATMTAVMPSGTPSQTTAWIYGVTTSGGSTLDSNDLLAKEEFPNATTGDASTSASDDVTYDEDNLGETIGMTDQNGTTHSYGLDTLGRPISDAVTTLGSGVDGTVVLRTTDYNQQGSVYQMTAYGSTLGGTVLNQVEDTYNGLGQLTAEYQSQSGAVDTSSTPKTGYTYSDPASGSLMTAMTYPNGRALNYGYTDNALDTAIGRVDYLADAGGSAAGHLVVYLYMGAGTMVQQAQANGVKLTYLQQSGDSSSITSGPQYAGDEVTGLDRFGQVIDQNWVNTSTPTPTSTDRFQYNYDQDGNVLYSNNLVNSSESELFHANSTTSGDDSDAYDPLNRLTAFARGTLSASANNGGVLDTISSPSTTQSWNLDAVGNQTGVTTNGTAVSNTTNAKNELSANGSASLTFDNNGNTLTDEAGNTYTYDAWNHIATVKNSSGDVIATYGYNAAGQRVSLTDASSTTTGYFYGGSGQIIELRVGSTVTAQYVYNIDYVNDVLLSDNNSTSGSLGISASGLGQRLFEQHSANFNVTALTNASGAVVQRDIYIGYGTMTVLSPSWTSTSTAYSFNPGFQGMWQDPVTGLYYTPNRDYDPATGTWREQDPYGYVDGSDRYPYCDSSPAEKTDAGGADPGPGNVGSLIGAYPTDNVAAMGVAQPQPDPIANGWQNGDQLINAPEVVVLPNLFALKVDKGCKIVGFAVRLPLDIWAPSNANPKLLLPKNAVIQVVSGNGIVEIRDLEPKRHIVTEMPVIPGRVEVNQVLFDDQGQFLAVDFTNTLAGVPDSKVQSTLADGFSTAEAKSGIQALKGIVNKANSAIGAVIGTKDAADKTVAAIEDDLHHIS